MIRGDARRISVAVSHASTNLSGATVDRIPPAVARQALAARLASHPATTAANPPRYASPVSDAAETNSARGDAVSRAADAYRALADLAETVEDEWQYVTDLVETYEPGILALAAANGARPLTAAEVAAVDEAIAEVALIEDPHKAIDWLSTFPHVVALAFGGDVDRPAGDAADDARAGGDLLEPGDDSPFGALRNLR